MNFDDFEKEVKNAIFDAFKDVTKGNGVGIREAIAEDEAISIDEIKKARTEDTEDHWWDIPDTLKDYLGTALNYTDKKGYLFLLPATMIAAIEGKGNNAGERAFKLYQSYIDQSFPCPDWCSKEFVGWLRRVNPKEIVSYYGFTKEQTHAVALFFKWWMMLCKDHLYADRQHSLEGLKFIHDQSYNASRSHPGHYTLSYEDIVAIFDEECRILSDWLKLGGVEIRD